ncbi:LysR substrate-binding domain-containing protein [Neorhizobium sp. NCHU2750]|uniref:LysR substrate-binding domain-containing protein n=1 Tax=Neorhizobium sp. NCHU2750 TaxID=1825976 RepID=UPI000E7213EF|nr:LysR family transcriptional regulator [Neorhizobium sp. NCHU2750]
MSRNLDIALLRTFVAVADHASMTAAGNALHLTQSAVSQQIARLERLAGKLFFRERRTLRLTAVGERLLFRARHMLVLNDELWSAMTERAIEGRVRLGAPYDLVGTWLTPILKTYAEHNPRVEVALVCLASPELIEAVDGGLIDLALVEEPIGASRGESLAVDRLVWVGARAGTAYLKNPLPVSMVAETCAFRPAVLKALDERHLAWRTLFESGSIDATRATVRADLAVTASLESTVPGDLAILLSGERLPELTPFSINLHRSKGKSSPAVAELARHIREGIAAGPQSQW